MKQFGYFLTLSRKTEHFEMVSFKLGNNSKVSRGAEDTKGNPQTTS